MTAIAGAGQAERDDLADRIEDLLPQTQCTKCGFDGCRPYAQALADGSAELNRCPPGGSMVIARLAELLSRPVRALDPDCGSQTPRSCAYIDESRCIGCTLCIQACPVDAILGAAKQMHTVLVSQCTGCELCLPACPVDCIDMPTMAALADAGCDTARMERGIPVRAHALRWRERHRLRGQRLARERAEREEYLLRKTQDELAMIDTSSQDVHTQRKREAVQAALARARLRRAAHAAPDSAGQ